MNAVRIGGGSGGGHGLLLSRANRHGLIAGATGTGKTVTLQTLAEGFSAAGVPVFAADVKGDLAGLAVAASPGDQSFAKVAARAVEIGLASWAPAAFPVTLWDVFGEGGHPVRATVSEMGPLLLARLLGLNETQEGVLAIAFRHADDEGLLLLDFADLRALLVEVGLQAKALSLKYGNVSRPSIGAIQRQLLQLEAQGGDRFFGEPALELADLMRTALDGRGVISILDARQLIERPRAHATMLLWLLAELFEELPEVGDLDKPKLVFFFDEAHLLFEGLSPALEEKIEQVVRLIRSKGVGVFFVTQNPADIPERIAAQLGNRIQHALRAFTPKDQRAIRAAADSFRANPGLDVETAITELKVGEALVSTLDAEGAPTPVERILIAPPGSRLGPLTDAERASIRASSPVGTRYDATLDRESAEELLAARAERRVAEEAASLETTRAAKDAAAAERTRKANPGLAEQMSRQVGTAVKRQVANRVASTLLRGLFGGLMRGR